MIEEMGTAAERKGVRQEHQQEYANPPRQDAGSMPPLLDGDIDQTTPLQLEIADSRVLLP